MVLFEYQLVECERHDGRQYKQVPKIPAVTEARPEQELTAGLPLPVPYLLCVVGEACSVR